MSKSFDFHPVRVACGLNYFECHNGACVPNTDVCDGFNDCSDGSDEAHCGNCLSGFFSCFASGRCVPNTDVCDAIDDCSDGSDEEDCDYTILNIVGIAVGVSIAAFILLLVLPIIIVTIIACRVCNRRNRYETVIVNPGPAPTVYNAGYGTAY